ncbi:histidine--tRNA ligase [Singulisphaera acidiphila]|uniref:Histidine--tRNA ligase n=1 Tax=Singulisphaera acidiphila (strain ATCC BAA-1392 / DSM 18658 / VKM B-2454 / MOB10) TaxID=886293 RepID=L0D9D2_SINAD|nr:histidine--tRNA ligase [Singulisphaera acidiphila]AGA25266.1 histidyl-tRNA synthetase [Singulisphaera acidiphila DSM 18658]
MIDPRVASGLRDIPPSVMIPRERMLASFRKTFASFGYLPIETPHIERMEVLTGKGAGSDEVLRQIFDVTNKGGTPGELALRFDLTVPLARFVAKHVNELGVPFKRYAIGSVFRGERPAKGRFREFMQCDFDTVGTESALADAETAQVIHDALASAGVAEFTITLNNRKILDGMLDTLGLADRTGSVLRALDKLAKIGREKVADELRKGDAESTERGAGLSEDQANRVLDFVEQGRGGAEVLTQAEETLGAHPRAADGIKNLREVLSLLEAAGVPSRRVRIDLGLARGLDYYTGVVFETTVNGWERFGSIASGGRYDNLASLFTERRLPGVGASIGLDRLLALMEEAGWLKGALTTVPILIANFPGVDPVTPVALAARLRAAGLGAEVFPEPLQVGKQMGYGSARGHKLAVIVGPDERASEVFNLRNLATRQEQKGIPQADLETAIAEALKAIEGTSS